MALIIYEEEDSGVSQSDSEDAVIDNDIPDRPFSYSDMSLFMVDIKNTFLSAITELKADLLALTEKMATADRAGHRRDKAIPRLESISEVHTSQLIAVNRHLEDLGNRGRRHNLRVKGVPETVSTDKITPALTSIFNNLLERPVDTLIESEHDHNIALYQDLSLITLGNRRALRPLLEKLKEKNNPPSGGNFHLVSQ